MIKKFAASWIIQLFCIFWAAFLFLDYINASGYFYDAFLFFTYADLLITLFLLTAFVTYLFADKSKIGLTLVIKNFRGIYHYIFTLLLMACIILFYASKMNISPSTASGTIVFIFKTLLFHSALGLILLAALSSGSYLLDKLAFSTEKKSYILISLALGFIVIVTGLFLFGALGILYQFVVLPFILLLILTGRKKLPGILRESFFKKSPPFEIHILGILAYSFLILFIALSLCSSTRTIPVGFDGLILYMNIPKLIAGYHGLTNGGDAYNWSLMMSLGFIMFNNTTITILLSVLPGILSILGIYRICSLLNLNRNWSLFACALFFSLPNLTWLSRIEEKVDLAMLFFTICCVILLLGKFTAPTSQKLKEKSKEQPKTKTKFSPELVYWGLLGLLIGFSFGIKYISMLSIFALLVVLFYIYSGKYAAIAIFFLNFAIIFGLNLTRFAAFEKDHTFFRFFVPFALSAFFLFLTLRKNRREFLLAGKYALVFCFFIGLTFLPWAIKHAVENKNFSVESMLTGKSPLPPLFSSSTNSSGNINKKDHLKNIPPENSIESNRSLAEFGITSLLASSTKRVSEFISELNSSIESETPLQTKEESTNEEKHEEIRRFLGYESGIIRFISLPYRIIMKSNVRVVTSDAGILLLIILPVFIFSFSFRELPVNILKIILLLLLLIVSIHSVQLMIEHGDRYISNDLLKSTDFSGSFLIGNLLLPLYLFLKNQLIHFGNILSPLYNSLTLQPLGICFVLIVLLSIPVYFVYKTSLTGLTLASKTLIAFTFCIVQYWLVLSSGIIWYGIAGFSLIPVIIALLANKTESNPYNNNFIKRYIVVCSALWFVLILPYQFIPSRYLTTTDYSKLDFNEFLNPQFVKYAFGEQNEKETLKHFLNDAQYNIVNTLNRDKKARVINISTDLNYYIINNDSRVYLDNQLGLFQDLYKNVNNNKELLAGQFKKANIKYILIGLNTPEIDRTPEKSLTKKFNELMIAMVNNPQVRLLYTNRMVIRPDGDLDINYNGSVVKAKYDMVGMKVLDQGTDALFEIL